MAALNLRALMSALREAIQSESVDRFLLNNLSGEPFGRQATLPYYQGRKLTARIADLVNDRGVRRRMLQQIERGVSMGADRWYDTRPLAAAFVNELGPQQGPVAFRNFIDYNAAMSPRSMLAPQIRRASYYYGAQQQGKRLPFFTPEGYGHMAQNVHQRLAARVRNGGFNVLTGPKTASYAENLAGNHMPVTVDSHALSLPALLSGDPRFLKGGGDSLPPIDDSMMRYNPRAEYAAGNLSVDDALERPVLWGGSPLKTEYGPLADYYHSLGQEFGLTGPQAQSSAWVGGGDITGVQSGPEPFMQHFVDRVRATAEARGESFAETLRKMIRGQAPLLSAAGLAALSQALSSDGGDSG